MFVDAVALQFVKFLQLQLPKFVVADRPRVDYCDLRGGLDWDQQQLSLHFSGNVFKLIAG